MICDIMNRSIILNREGRHHEQKRKTYGYIINITYMRFRRYGNPWMRSSERNRSDEPVPGIFTGTDRERKTAALMAAVFVSSISVQFVVDFHRNLE